MALLYLKLRNFNFDKWKIEINLKTILLGALIFIGAALLQDIYTMFTATFLKHFPIPMSLGFFNNETVSTVIYSLFNGIYEEIYFLGIVGLALLDASKI